MSPLVRLVRCVRAGARAYLTATRRPGCLTCGAPWVDDGYCSIECHADTFV